MFVTKIFSPLRVLRRGEQRDLSANPFPLLKPHMDIDTTGNLKAIVT